MDHIELPAQSFQQVLKVPYLAQHHPLWAYDGLGFVDYPDRKGFDKIKFVRGQFESGDLEFALAILQSWCYFGLVIEFFRIIDVHVSVEDFLNRDASGDISVTSIRLPGLLRTLERMERKMDEDERAEYFLAFDSLLTAASDFVSEIDVEYLYNRFDEHPLARLSVEQVLPSVLDAVHLSVVLLGRYLELGVGLFNTYGKWWGQSPYIEQRLLQAGWCRSETFTLVDQLSGKPECLYYIAGISRHTNNRAYEHRHCGDSLRCNRENLDRERYKTRHTLSCADPDDCAKISFEEPGSPNIYSIVGKNLVPVVTAISGTNDRTPFCSIACTSSSKTRSNDPTISETTQIPYVCISHVWSDGLGNLKENAIPQCQMLRLQILVDKLFEPEQRPVHFWLDTLCVPLQNPHRRIAINSMKSIYQGASKVLVIDSILGQTTVREVEIAELAMRVRVSTWGRRLWTFHEACLAQRVYYQYRDEALTSLDLRNLVLKRQLGEDEEWRRLCDDKWDFTLPSDENPTDLFTIFDRKSSMDPIEAEALSWVTDQEGSLHRASEHPLSRRLAILTNCLRYRWTSWLEDETICLSGILGLEVEQLISISESTSIATQERRMQHFLGSFNEVQADILFVKTPRLTQKGSRWMPKSFLGKTIDTYSMGFEKGIPMNEGLLVRLPGMLLPKIGTRRPQECVYVRYEDVFLELKLTDTAELECNDYCQKSSAIVFRYPLNLTDLPAPGMISMSTEGLWVTFESDHHRNGSGCMTVRFGQHVSVETCAVDDLPLDTQDLLVSAESCGPRQRWCVC